jgi:deoxyribodipyrimidine photo-lyase
MTVNLCWHRRDLRVRDNTALEAATASGPAVPVFVVDPAILEHAGPPRVQFMIDGLRSLRAAYRERGGDLLVRRGDPARILPDLATSIDADAVHWNADYSGLARERDERTHSALDAQDVETASHHDALLHEPGSIRTNEGEVYSVYSYFWKKWRDRPTDDPRPAPDGELLAAPLEPGPIPTLDDLGFEAPEANVEPASPERARDRMSAFCSDDIYRYEEARNYPAKSGTARLSTHLKWGTIGPRTVYAATERALEDADEWAGQSPTDSDVEQPVERDAAQARENVREFQSQLAWRDFYGHVLWNRPDTVHANFKDFANPIEWREDPAALQRWKDGETGYPIVDAGMRQLRSEAWMHNRVRMIVAAFLTKDLLIDWREGYAWFREKLADHDTANDVGGWQWAASTGTDAQPYFRIFNPTTQGERYDPDAEYIRRFVDELATVPADAIHDWPNLDAGQRTALAPDYPAPIVEHADRREAAIATFEAARGDD